jgi:hypothetical protein
MATNATNKITYLLATKAIDFVNDTFQIILMADGYVFDKDDHEYYADVSASELTTGNGYTAGGQALTNNVVTENDTDNRTDIEFDDAAWTASGGSIGPTPGAIIFDDSVANDPIVGYIYFGGDKTQADGGIATIANPGVRISSVATA